MPRHGSPKRSQAAVEMQLEKYICRISIEEGKLGGARFSELPELEQLYKKIAKQLRIIAREMCEIANDKPLGC